MCNILGKRTISAEMVRSFGRVRSKENAQWRTSSFKAWVKPSHRAVTAFGELWLATPRPPWSRHRIITSRSTHATYQDLITKDLEHFLTFDPQMLSDRGLRPRTLQTLFGRGANISSSSVTSPLEEPIDVVVAAGTNNVFIENKKICLDDLFDEDDPFDAENCR